MFLLYYRVFFEQICSDVQFISPPEEMGEFLLHLLKQRTIYRPSKLHQFQLLLPGQLLDPVLPAHGLLLCGKAFVIHQLHRPFGPGIFGACFAFIMGFHPPGKTVCPPSVECAVRTLHDVCIIHISFPFCKKFRQCNTYSNPLK